MDRHDARKWFAKYLISQGLMNPGVLTSRGGKLGGFSRDHEEWFQTVWEGHDGDIKSFKFQTLEAFDEGKPHKDK